MRSIAIESLITRESSEKSTLISLGYQVFFRTEGWVECLVSNPDEAWHGAGADESAALRDALRHMLPSSLARDSFEKLQAQQALPERLEPSLAEFLAAPPAPEVGEEFAFLRTASVPLNSVKIDALLDADSDTLPTAPPREPFEETEQNLSSPPSVVDAAPESPASFVADEPAVLDEPQHRDVLKVRPEPVFTVEEGLERVVEIMTEIRDEAEDLGRMSPLKQRHHVASWIFRARAVQEVWVGSWEIERAVHEAALALTDLCKRYWPGSVRALQLATHPSQALEGLVSGPSVNTWQAAATRIETEIDHSHVVGRDEWGWSDTIRVLPSDAHVVLEEAVSKIESVVGPLGLSADVRQRSVASNVIENGLEDLVVAAHLLRWTRRSELDGKRWGTAMGVLRWVCHMLGRTAQPLRDAVADHYVPAVDWAELLGRDPKINRERATRHRVMTCVPTTETSRPDLCSWLSDAFVVLTNPQIAKMIETSHQSVLSLSNDDFAGAERSARSRLRRLQEYIRRGVLATDVVLPEIDATAPSSADDQGDARSAADTLLERVRPAVAGKRILFVTNREDEVLQQRLQEDLGCHVMVRDGGTDRKVQQIVASVVPGAFDMILVATSFASHKLDSLMSRSAKQLGIPYVRVNKGRPLATVRALARLFSVAA